MKEVKNDRNNDSWNLLLDKYFYEKRLKPDTEWTYRKVVRLLLAYLHEQEKSVITPDDLTREILLRWRRFELNIKKVADRTWNTKVRHLQALFSFWIKMGWVRQYDNPCSECQVIPGTRRKKYLTEKQLRTIYRVMEQFREQESQLGFEKATYRCCAMYPTWFWLTTTETLRLTGMRLNQLIHIRMIDISFEECEINLVREGSKSHREYPVVLLDDLKPHLERLIREMSLRGVGETEPLFNVHRLSDRREDRVKPIHSDTVRAFFRRLSRECGFHVSPHRFRHTLGTTLMRSPERNIQLTKELLGHRSLASTMEYIGQDTIQTKVILENELKQYLKMGLGGEHQRLTGTDHIKGGKI